MIAACTLAAALALAPAAGEAEELRALLHEALREPGGRATKAQLARAGELAESMGREAFLEALRAGPLLPEDALEPRPGERRTEHDGVVVGYEFESGGERYRYALDLPRGYDPAEPRGLLLDPGHGSAKDSGDSTRAEMLGMYRRHADAAGMKDWIVARTEIVEQIGAGGARGGRADDEVAAVFGDFFRDLATRVALDPDRVLVVGLSQTGYWSWYLGRARADRLAGIGPMSAVSRLPADAYLGNFLNLPTYVLHGDADPTCPVGEVRATCARLALLGAPVEYAEVEGGAHDYAVWGRQPEALEWLAARPRERHPRRISKSLSTARDGWCYWLRVDALERQGEGRAASPPTGGVDAELEGQTLRLYSEGVERLTLSLPGELVDLDAPVTVLWNGERVHAGPLERELARTFAVAVEKVDWSALAEGFLALER